MSQHQSKSHSRSAQKSNLLKTHLMVMWSSRSPSEPSSTLSSAFQDAVKICGLRPPSVSAVTSFSPPPLQANLPHSRLPGWDPQPQSHCLPPRPPIHHSWQPEQTFQRSNTTTSRPAYNASVASHCPQDNAQPPAMDSRPT